MLGTALSGEVFQGATDAPEGFTKRPPGPSSVTESTSSLCASCTDKLMQSHIQKDKSRHSGNQCQPTEEPTHLNLHSFAGGPEVRSKRGTHLAVAEPAAEVGAGLCAQQGADGAQAVHWRGRTEQLISLRRGEWYVARHPVAHLNRVPLEDLHLRLARSTTSGDARPSTAVLEGLTGMLSLQEGHECF